jgi:hypothetical protein
MPYSEKNAAHACKTPSALPAIASASGKLVEPNMLDVEPPRVDAIPAASVVNLYGKNP